ncbi:MAG: acetylxylan esterase [Bacteroidota bacterium]
MKQLLVLFSLLFLLTCPGLAQKKEHDTNVNYDESKVPAYSLPALLKSANGTIIQTPEQWRTIRRPEILSLFANLVYGQIPVPESPIQTTARVRQHEPNFLDGKATRKIVQLEFENKKGKASMDVLLISPNQISAPVPVFQMISFDAADSDKMQLNPEQPHLLNNGWPIQEIIDRGFALVTTYHSDLVRHNEHEFRQGIHPLFFKTNQSFPKADEWGVISAIGWGAMRALDYLAAEPGMDQNRVALIGHSKLGKATLWAAAQDERFAMAISIQSGCGGAALWRRRYGETLEKINRFPHWLATNSRKFTNQEEDLPVDQHMLLALIAPRPLYISSATQDGWADPRGEYLSAYHASEVYRFLGKKGLTDSNSPAPNQAINQQHVAYHIKEGRHRIDLFDWKQYLDFAEFHFLSRN